MILGGKGMLSKSTVKRIAGINEDDCKGYLWGYLLGLDNAGIASQKKRCKSCLLAFEATELCGKPVLGCPWEKSAKQQCVMQFPNGI